MNNLTNSSFEDMTRKRVSFLVPTKNRADFLDKALKKHIKLLKRDDELIIIDGGSTDKTLHVLKKYHKYIDIIISEPDQSEAHAFNKGVLSSHGRYIKILSDDDEFYSEGMEQAIKILEDNPEIDVLLCGGTKSRGNRKTYAYAPNGSNYGSNPRDVFQYGGCGMGMIIRKRSLAQTGLFTLKSISLDNDYLVKSIVAGARIKFCRINLFHHNLEDHSGAVQRTKELYQDIERIKKQYKIQDSSLVEIKKWANKFILPWLPNVIKIPIVSFKKIFDKPKTKTAIIWDGGIS